MTACRRSNSLASTTKILHGLRFYSLFSDFMYITTEVKFYAFETVKMTAAAHDTTGGMETKISEAAMIAKLGIDVYIVKACSLPGTFDFEVLNSVVDGLGLYNAGSNKPLIEGTERRTERR